jgi:hypothetical protein
MWRALFSIPALALQIDSFRSSAQFKMPRANEIYRSLNVSFQTVSYFFQSLISAVPIG